MAFLFDGERYVNVGPLPQPLSTDVIAPAPPVPAAPAVLAAPAPPPPPAFDPLAEPVYGPSLAAILSQQRALPSIYNPQRQGLATNTALGLTEGGYYENAQAAPDQARVGTDSQGYGLVPDITYKIVVGPEGRLYRQAFMNPLVSYNARGLGSSSARLRDQATARAQVQANADRAIRGFESSQSGLTTSELGQAATLGGNWAQTLGQQAAYRASLAPPPAPEAPSAPDAGAPAAALPVTPIAPPPALDTSPLPGVQRPMRGDLRAVGGPAPGQRNPVPPAVRVKLPKLTPAPRIYRGRPL